MSLIRFFRQFLLLFLVHLTSTSMFRCIASLFQTVVASLAAGSLSIMFVLLFGGFVIPKRNIANMYIFSPDLVNRINVQIMLLTVYYIIASMPVWLKWGFWISPLAYGEIGLTVNEFLAPRWEKVIFNQ